MCIRDSFYSKINTFNTIFYFDWLLGVGVGKITETNNRSEFLNGGSSLSIADQTEEHNAGLWQAAIKFYINETFEDIKTTIELSEKFYENSFYSIKEIPLSFRFSILVARRVYRKIGYKILNKQNIENYKKSGKIYVSNIEKIIETFLSIFDLIKLSLISKNINNINHDHNLINEEINLNERI